jgi:hypothetical protein
MTKDGLGAFIHDLGNFNATWIQIEMGLKLLVTVIPLITTISSEEVCNPWEPVPKQYAAFNQTVGGPRVFVIMVLKRAFLGGHAQEKA